MATTLEKRLTKKLQAARATITQLRDELVAKEDACEVSVCHYLDIATKASARAEEERRRRLAIEEEIEAASSAHLHRRPPRARPAKAKKSRRRA